MPKPKRTKPTTHLCPGGCGDQVPNRQFACPTDWRRLPKELQDLIYDTASRTLLDPERMTAVTAARQWFNEHQPKKPDTLRVSR